MQVAAGSIIGGKYRLDRPVSRGGMGAVWAGRHLQLGSPVAVKFMDPSYAGSPAFRARFEREARAAASLQSPHVVGVQDYGIDGDSPYIVMELLQGEDLHTRLERHGRLALSEASRLLTQLGKALRRAHDAGLVHRDLKPRNIFLARVEDDDEIAKILDFGIAKDTVSKTIGESTNTGELMGSPHYMSPEQLRADKDLDGRSDLWSLGVILYRCLTGYLPFPGEVLGTVMAKVLIDPVPPVAQLAPDLPPALDVFFARALARDRAQRFQTVRELVDAFNQIAGAAPLGSTVAGAHMSPFAVPASEPRPRPSLSSLPAFEPPWPTPGSIHAAATPGATPAAPLHPTPAGMPAGTLTTAGMVAGDPFGRARRMRAVWVASIATVLVLGVAGTMTALRVAGGDEAEPAAASPPPSAVQPAETTTAAAPEVPSVQPAEAQPIDLDAPAPDPAETGSKPVAAPAGTSTAKTSKAGATSAPAKTATPVKTATPAKSAAPVATGTKPSWGF